MLPGDWCNAGIIREESGQPINRVINVDHAPVHDIEDTRNINSFMFIYTTQASVGLDCKPGGIQEKLFNYLFNLAKYTGKM